MSFYSELSAIAGQENIEENVSFRKLTTFMAGGNARWFVSPASEETLRKLLSFLNEAHVPYFLLGRGANVLASDRGYEGVIVSLRKHFSDVVCDGPYLRAGAGALMADVSKAALDHGLTGLEFMSGIPGTVGGGLFMNAGAYGGEIKDVTVSVRILEKDGAVRTVANEEMGFSYRHSALSENGAV
ncbi:MAG: FAD-binding protein, partial [Lachnospiraceae bacterium]|nr:FAD-binding protein [Lachnospiraceae bacterium]